MRFGPLDIMPVEAFIERNGGREALDESVGRFGNRELQRLSLIESGFTRWLSCAGVARLT